MVQCIEAPSTFATKQSLNQSQCYQAEDSQLDIQLAQLDLDVLNQQLEQATPQEILAWCICHIPKGLVQTTSLACWQSLTCCTAS